MSLIDATTPPPAPPPPNAALPRRHAAGVVIATLNRPAGDTGVHTHTRVLHDGLTQHGVACDVISPFTGSSKWLPIFAVRPLVLQRMNKTWSTRWHRHWHRLALQENLAAHLRESPTAAVIAQCPVSARAALDVRDLMRRPIEVALVCHFNGSEAAEYREKGELDHRPSFHTMMAFEDAVLRRVDRTIYVSDWARKLVEQERGLRSRKPTVIYNGIAPDVPAGGVTRASLGLSDDDLVLINVGTLEPRKNQFGLLDLFAQIGTPRAKLLLVGEGPDRARIEAKIARANLGRSVQLLGNRRDVPALLAISDLYLHYAMVENCPMALLEAARAALPWAAVPVGGIPELAARLESGVPLNPADPAQSARALLPLLSDPALRGEVGRRARYNFDLYFTQEAMVRAYMNALGIAAAEVPQTAA